MNKQELLKTIDSANKNISHNLANASHNIFAELEYMKKYVTEAIDKMGDNDTSKIMFCPDIGCAYRWSKEYGVLEFQDLKENGVIVANDEWLCVDEDIIGDEEITFKGKVITFSQVYRIVETELGVKQ